MRHRFASVLPALQGPLLVMLREQVVPPQPVQALPREQVREPPLAQPEQEPRPELAQLQPPPVRDFARAQSQPEPAASRISRSTSLRHRRGVRQSQFLRSGAHSSGAAEAMSMTGPKPHLASPSL